MSRYSLDEGLPNCLSGTSAFCNVSPGAQLFQLVRTRVSVSVPDASEIIVKYREEFMA